MQTGIKSASVLFPCPAPAHPGTAKKRIGKTRITKKSISVLHRYSRIDSIFFITKIISAHLSGVNLEHGNEKFQRKNEKAATKKAQPRQKETGLRSAFCY